MLSNPAGSMAVLALAMSDYPQPGPERDHWILDRRPPRHSVDPFKPHAFLVERERADSGETVEVATVFLTNRECPWRCLMCDLWRNTLPESVPVGAIPAQIDHALSRLGVSGTASTVTQVKLYNSGSFFDAGAIPVADYPAIAERVGAFERVVVESHPALVGDRCLSFQGMLGGPGRTRLEVAMGLETANPEVLDQLNKRMTLDQFRRAADFLQLHHLALRVFVLVKPPFLDEDAALHWAKRSIDFAFDCGATVVSLIPTRAGNGALDALAASGEFSPPRLATLEAAHEYGVGLKRGRVFADLWDLEKFSACANCFDARRARLDGMNLCQELLPNVPCECGSR